MLPTRLKAIKGIADLWRLHGYYDDAESEAWKGTFWAEGSPFVPLFEQLVLGDVLELACGHGRHAEKIIDRCRSLTLVDVNQTNIDACRKRFGRRPNLKYVVNKGYELPVADRSLDSIFCYDAMVHFDVASVMNYLEETARVLRPGGRALYHHSVYDRAPGSEWTDNPHYRNFMSMPLFQHLAISAGLKVLHAQVMDWSGVPQIDGLTLLER